MNIHDLQYQRGEHILVYISHYSISMVILVENGHPMTPLAPIPADTVPSASKNALQLSDIPTSSLPAIKKIHSISLFGFLRLCRISAAYICYLHGIVAWNEIVACVTIRHEFPKFKKSRKGRERELLPISMNDNEC